MNYSEKYILDLCQSSFLNLWCFPNPVGKKGKELCDILVVCGTHIIIFSVKEIEITETESFETDNSRWLKRAIGSSVNQIYGAERIINSGVKIFDSNNNQEILLPNFESRKIHRIAIALGRKNQFFLQYGDFGKGYTHVFDEEFVEIIFEELNTITDFINYLDAKEAEQKLNNTPYLYSEKDLLAFYIMNGNRFNIDPENPNDVTFILENDIWDGWIESPEYKELKQFQEPSKYWDEIINEFLYYFSKQELIIPIARNTFDKSIFNMALEPRCNRVFLGKAIQEFINPKSSYKSTSRITHSPNNREVIYVLTLRNSLTIDREFHIQELQLRLMVARKVLGAGETAIGIGMDLENSIGCSYDLCCVDFSEWDEDDDLKAQEIQDEFGYYKQVETKNSK